MNIDVGFITAGGLSSLILQGLKLFWRKFIVKDLFYDFSQNFYLVAIPVLNILVIPVLALLGMEGFEIPVDWLGWGRNILLVFLSSLISLGTYTIGIKPLKTYGYELKLRREKEAKKKAKTK